MDEFKDFLKVHRAFAYVKHLKPSVVVKVGIGIVHVEMDDFFICEKGKVFFIFQQRVFVFEVRHLGVVGEMESFVKRAHGDEPVNGQFRFRNHVFNGEGDARRL